MIVAIDGAATDVSVALADPAGAVIAEDAWTAPGRQSAELLPRLLAVVTETRRPLDTLTVVGVGLGPGSFTGLRVALALGKGLALALDRPIVGVPSLEAWLDAEPEATAAIARAGAREAYVLRRGQDGEPDLVAAEALGDLSGPVVAPNELAAAFDLAEARAPRGATAIARRVADRLRANPAGDDLATLEPIYLRAPRGVPAGADRLATWP